MGWVVLVAVGGFVDLGLDEPPPLEPDSVDLAIDTATAISGVYPTNHADRFELVVPVLPAAGRPTPMSHNLLALIGRALGRASRLR